MNASAENESGDVAEMQAFEEEVHREILDFLRPLKRKFARFAAAAPQLSTSDPPLEPLQMSRRLFAVPYEQLSSTRLFSLARLYANDHELGNRLLAHSQSKFAPGGLDMEQWKALRRNAIRELLQYSTDDFTRGTWLIAANSLDEELLLEEFFDSCKNSNPAEMALLADATGFSEQQISEYFIGRKQGLRELFVVRNGIRSYNVRKQELESERTVTKKKPIESH